MPPTLGVSANADVVTADLQVFALDMEGSPHHLQDTLRNNHGKQVALSHLESRCTHIEHMRRAKRHCFTNWVQKGATPGNHISN